MVKGRPNVIDRALNSPTMKLNGWTFTFNRYARTRPLLSSGGCRVRFSPDDGIRFSDRRGRDWQLPIDIKGRFLRRDGRPIVYSGRVVSINGENGNGADINFWRWVLGLDGSLVAGRQALEDPNEFFDRFLLAVNDGSSFDFALNATTDDHGAVLFEHGKRRIPLLARNIVHEETPFSNSPIVFVPDRIVGGPVMLAFSRRHSGCVGEFDFDYDHRLFFFESGGMRRYFIAPHINGAGVAESTVAGHRMFFCGRKTAKLIRVDVAGGGIMCVKEPYSGSSMKIRELDGIGGVLVGRFSRQEVAQMGKNPQVKILTHTTPDGRVYYFNFGGFHYIKSADMKRHQLKPGDLIEVEPINGKVSAFVKVGKNGARITYILNWRWKGNGFELDNTSSFMVTRSEMVGCRVLEQFESQSRGPQEMLEVGGMVKTIIGNAPFKKEPLPLSALIMDGKEILFLRDAPRFSKEDWELAEIIAKAKEGSFDREKCKPSESKEKTKEAEVAAKTAGAKLFDISGLERAHDMFIEAYKLDPLNFSCLSRAYEVRKRIIELKRHITRRNFYFDFFKTAFAGVEPKDYPAKMAHFFGEGDQNPLSVACALQVLAEERSSSFGADLTRLERIFSSLPLVLDRSSLLGKRLMLALRILVADPDFAFIPKWVLTHPSKGKEPLFRKRRRKLKIAESAFEIDWCQVAKSKGKKQSPDSQVEKLVRQNMGLAYFFAKRYYGYVTEGIITRGELDAAAQIGLFQAARHYDPSRGSKFSTCALYWIRDAIQEAVSERRGRRKNGPIIVSMQEPIGDDDRTVGDEIGDERVLPSDEGAQRREAMLQAKIMLDSLPPRERKILVEHFGFDGSDGRSLEKVGKDAGLTRERIRQLRNRSMARLGKNFPGARDLLD